ncbi:hypothetical protein [Porphyromonas levii]|nr:hypothetical protein [Porphyromonas levii]
MSFVSFVIVCVVALIGYYAYLILKPEKKGFSYGEVRNPFKATDIAIEPPISVTIDMVSYTPIDLSNPPEDTPPQPEQDVKGTQGTIHINKYDNNTTVSNSSISNDEISLYLTTDLIKQSKSLFKTVMIA